MTFHVIADEALLHDFPVLLFDLRRVETLKRIQVNDDDCHNRQAQLFGGDEK